MQLGKILKDGTTYVVLVDGDAVRLLRASGPNLRQLLEADHPLNAAKAYLSGTAITVAQACFLPPLDDQEVWAAGVTYKRSRTARMEESQGAERFYDLVYEAPRPELFFKAAAHRVVGPGGEIRIRQDSRWNVPEPELTLVINSRLQIVGYTVGNDVSSRDIEGENPLYLPQAKVYSGSCALGPWITLAAEMPTLEQTEITVQVQRSEQTVFEGKISASQIHRKLHTLVEYLGQDNSFPHGVFLMTGTGIVPDASFTLQPRDVVNISISGIGQLSNRVVQG